MVFLLIYLLILLAVVWYLGLRATALYGAYLGGALAQHLGLHLITILFCAIGGAAAVYAIIMILSAMSEKRPWIGALLIVFICGPGFLVGYGMVTQLMESAGNIEIIIIGTICGLVTAGASFGAYQRDISNSL